MSLRDELQTVYDAHGMLTPELVVEAARPKDHPLHSHIFDRPKAEAAEAWYRERAHQLIRTVRIAYSLTEEDGPLRSVRAFQAVRLENGYTYEPSEKVATDPLLREIVLRDMEREWRQLQSRYGAFEEFVQLISSDLAKEAA